jgi:3'-phosphoadenosine 5'-phosphosulfate synthase
MCSPFTDCCANRLCYSQHEAIIADGMLDAATTVMAIWPAPMIYAGPTEVRFLDLLSALFFPPTRPIFAPTCTVFSGVLFSITFVYRIVSVWVGWLQVLFHAKSRRNAGATYFVAGRDPAGMKGSSLAQAHPDDDLYDGNHGRCVRYPIALLPAPHLVLLEDICVACVCELCLDDLRLFVPCAIVPC